MKLLNTISETRRELRHVRQTGGLTVGLVPTMGALHEGHMALIRRAREECNCVVVSIFVNPTQFGPSEDLDKYPRTLAEDAEKCRQAGVDIVFAPAASEMYPQGFDTWVEVKGITDMLEGQVRPGHFRGVTTVCAKLFNIIDPDYAYFGTKDYQQLKVIEKMARELDMRLRIVPVDTVRDADGLAKSSRNVYLSTAERQAALALSRSLRKAREAYEAGERNAGALRHIILGMIEAEPLAAVDYVAITDADTLAPIEQITRPVAVLLAVRIGPTRLIDNTVLGITP